MTSKDLFPPYINTRLDPFEGLSSAVGSNHQLLWLMADLLHHLSYIHKHKLISRGGCRLVWCLFDWFGPIRESSRQKTQNSTQTQLKRTSLTWQLRKTVFALPIMSAITQLYSLCVHYFQNVNFNQAKQEGREEKGGGVVLLIGSK